LVQPGKPAVFSKIVEFLPRPLTILENWNCGGILRILLLSQKVSASGKHELSWSQSSHKEPSPYFHLSSSRREFSESVSDCPQVIFSHSQNH